MQKRPGDEKKTEESITVQLEHVCLQYPYKQLEAATKNFHDSCRLGEGSAGTVFKAELPDGSNAAVKVIDLSTLGDNLMVAGFEDEIMILSKFRHPNLVVLMGWAKEGTRRFLLYEFLSGGDVSGRLQKSKDGRMPFLWHERLSVVRDAATGLAYLHNATPRAFHRDIKTSNILLGPSGAKMADFGLSVVAKTHTGSGVDCEFPSGTPGYACPIYMRTGKVTEGSEVHSFGMVLLEVLLNLVPAGMVAGEVKFPIQEVVKPMVPGAVERATSSADPTAGWVPQVAKEVATLALKCIDADEARRPCFTDICRQLRTLQEQFPPTCVLAPQISFSTPGVPPPMPGMTGVCGPVSPAFGGMAPPALGPLVPDPGMPLPGGPGPPGPGGPLGTVWLQPPVQGAGAPPWSGPLPPGGPHGPAVQLPPPALAGPAGSLRLAPGAALQPAPGPGPGYQPQPPGPPPPNLQAPPGWQVTAMGPVMPGPPVGLGPQAVAVPGPLQMLPPEIALEITYVHLAVLSMMRPEFRMLPLSPTVDSEGRRCAKLGRAHQPQWFEAVLVEALDLGCISREACEFCWGGPDPAQAGLLVRTLGTTTVIVDDGVIERGGTASLHPGSRITLAKQTCPGGDLCVIISLAVHCAPAVVPNGAPGPGRPGAAVPPGVALPPAAFPDRRSVLVHVETVNVKDKMATSPPRVGQPTPEQQLPQELMWRLECVYSGMAPEAFLALPASMRTVPLALGPGMPAKIIGRQHQPEIFEALLGRENSLLAMVSRNHFRLEAAQDGSVKVTNMSQNIAVVAQRPLHQNDTAEVMDGDTLSFAHTVAHEARSDGTQDHSLKPIDSTVNIVPFLTWRLVPTMVSRGTALVLLCGCLAGISLQSVLFAFTTISKPSSVVTKATNVAATSSRQAVLNGDLMAPHESDYQYVSPWETAFRLLSGFVVGLLLMTTTTSPVFADNLEETAIPVDGKGKTITLTKEEIIRGKRLFNNACANCHVGGGTRTNQNVGLGFEELSGAQPPRNNIDSLVDYINAPTTYDGLKDIAEVHPSIKAADVWPKMQTMKQKDLYDISSYILYQNFTIPEKWGGGKQYY